MSFATVAEKGLFDARDALEFGQRGEAPLVEVIEHPVDADN